MVSNQEATTSSDPPHSHPLIKARASNPSYCPLVRPSQVQCERCVAQTCNSKPGDFSQYCPNQKKITPVCPACQNNKYVINMAFAWYGDEEEVEPSYQFFCIKCKKSFS